MSNSIEQNLVTIAENRQKIYDAGGNAIINELKELQEGTASGAIVSITDVSSAEHDVNVKLSSDTITDFSIVKLNVQGKNLFDSGLEKLTTVKYIPVSTGVEATRTGWEMELIAGVTYTVKATPKESSFTESYLYGCVTDKDDKVKKTTPLVANQQLQTHTFTAEDGWKLKLYDGIAQNGLTDTKTMVSKFNIQLEIGEKATPYEPHIQPVTYIPNADGTIEGVKSVCPNMTLLTNTEGVMIECAYKKDINPIFDKYVRD